jgi:hypothetical protein
MMKSIGYAVLAIAALTSVFFVNALKPTNLIAAMFFSAWLLLPYAALAFVLGFLARERASEIAYATVTLLVAASGLLFLADVIFLHPDPQAPIAVLFAPIYQAIGIIVLVPIGRWMTGRSSA